jgi:hypothetical protein
MATTGEVVWAGHLAMAGKLVPEIASANIDHVSFEFKFRDRNWQPLRSGNVYTFRFVDFALTNKDRKAPKLRLVFTRSSLGQTPVTTVLSVFWPCSFRFLNKHSLWEIRFSYDPKKLKFKVLPQSTPLSVLVKPKHGQSVVLGNLPPQKLYQIADLISGRSGRVNRKLRLKNTRQTKSVARPSPEIRTIPYSHYREQQGIPYAFIGTDNVTVYDRTHSGLNRTPNFGSLHSSKMPINSHSVTLNLTTVGQAIDFRKNDAGTTWFNTSRAFTQVFLIPAPTIGTPSPNTRNKAIKQLQERSSQGVSNIAVDVAQYRQFSSLVANSAARIVNSVRMLRRGNLVGATDALIAGRRIQRHFGGRLSKSKTLAQNWLELQYGWKPLLSDIVEGREALRQFALKNEAIRVVRASGSETQRVSGKILDGGVNPVLASTIGRYETAFLAQYKYAIRFRASNHLKSLLQQTGFNNPISFGWELLPFSFVADWFLPIGPYLECMSANQGLTFLDGSETFFSRREHSVAISFSGQLAGYSAFNNRNARLFGNYSQTRFVHTRTKLITFPGVTFPTFKNPLSVTHALNGIALLRAVFQD